MRYSMTSEQKIQAAMLLRDMADSEGNLSLTVPEIQDFLIKTFTLDLVPSKSGIKTIVDGAGVTPKEEARKNVPMAQVWNKIKDQEERITSLEIELSKVLLILNKGK